VFFRKWYPAFACILVYLVSNCHNLLAESLNFQFLGDGNLQDATDEQVNKCELGRQDEDVAKSKNM